MRRHPDLVALSHEHHHGLVHALRLRRAAAEDDPARWLAVARDFLRFFADETDPHFRAEETSVFPLLRRYAGERCEPLVRAVDDHAELRTLVAELAGEAEHGAVRGGALEELAARLEAHIRLEERELFPLLEGLADEAELRRLAEALEPQRRVATANPRIRAPR